MSAIAAMIGTKANRDTVHKMLERMRHRGPDQVDFVEDRQVLLGHSWSMKHSGDEPQPLTIPAEKLSIVCNGEFYNAGQMRETTLRDVEFSTHSDVELLLHLYNKYGCEAAGYLEGMFAFVVADMSGDEPQVYAARDPLGIKPLYYGETEGTLYFASELKGLFGLVEDVREFPAGHYYTPETGFVRYRTVTPPKDAERISAKADVQDALSKLSNILEMSVRKRLPDEVPLGVLLSGGLDSSLIAGLVRRLRPGETLKSFSVGFAGSSDIVAAREVARYLDTEHYEYMYDEKELFAAVPEVIYHLESFEPSLVRSAIPNYFVARLAAEHVPVILSGEGADECFSGYAYLKDIRDPRAVSGIIS